MKTIRRYHNVAEADFAWSLLRSAGIEAVLFDHNVGGSNYFLDPSGMRLQVPDADVEDALEILTVQPEFGPEVDSLPVTPTRNLEESGDEPSTSNPYEILVLAAPFIIGGVILLLKEGQSAVVVRGSKVGIISPLGVHWFGMAALIFGFALLVLYLCLRHKLRKDSR